jgi:hypothetical protein
MIYRPGFLGIGLHGNDTFTKALLHMDGANGGTTFTDSNAGGSAHTWTASSATTSTVAKKFGTASMLAAGGWISTGDHADFTLGSGAWTVDFWLNRNGNSGACGIFGQQNAAFTTASLSINAQFTGANVILAGLGIGAAFISITSTTAISDSNWRHIAFVRNGNDVNLYIGGSAEGGTATIAGSINDSGESWHVGRQAAAGTGYSGYIDEFRLSVGIARWTANFTPPINPYG